MAIIDADRFKVINDTYGHDVGDRVLQELARVLTAELRGVDQIGRLGGEEFSILFPETERSKALAVCQRVLSKIRGAAVRVEDKEIRFTVSIGLTQILASGDKADTILKRADRALYRAKELGRDRCEVA